MVPLELPDEVTLVLDAIRDAGGRPLIVGGAVRDHALGLATKDVDVEVYGIGLDPLSEALSRSLRVSAVGRSFGVLKVHTASGDIDVSLPRRESKAGRGHRGFLVDPDPTMTPHEAASRRDFTVNALMFDPDAGKLLDPFGGLADLEHRRLRHVGPRFVDDPLRVLRGMQFAGRFDMSAEPETIDLCRQLFVEYDTLAQERIWVEWWKWATKSRRPSAGLALLRATTWWEAYPELVALAGCPQDPEWHPEGDVWTHTMLVVDAAARVAIRDRLDPDARGALLLAALCHDLGKPETTFEEKGRIRSPGHAECDGTYRCFLGRIGCPHRIEKEVVALCRHHLAHMSFAGSRRHVRRLARALGEQGATIETLARLVEADHDSRPPLPGGLPEQMRQMLDAAGELAMAAAAPARILLGRHLLELGLDPGPDMGKLLAEAYEAQLDGAFDSLEGARRWLRERGDGCP